MRPSAFNFSKAATVVASGVSPRQCSRYRSITSVPRRSRLRAQASGTPVRVALCGLTLVTRNTRSRRPEMAAPTTRSAAPLPYSSAVSITVMPSSMPRRITAASWLAGRWPSPIFQVP